METKLVVVRPVAGRARGDVVTDPEEMRRLLGSEQVACVVRVLTKPEEK